MFLKLGPLLVPKTRTPLGNWLQQLVLKSPAIFNAKNWNRCHRACTIARLCASLRRRENRNRSNWHDCRDVVSARAQPYERRPLYQCVSDGLVHMSVFPRDERAHIACLGVPPTGHNLPPNTRGSQIILGRYINAATGSHGLYLGRCSSG